ncbi:cell division protein FtsQ/DivIB [Deinococcus lacus]|uniref:Cell division protein FtsQ/DivIB n=1 Tax=Deinococcus lacus TaxID=392561 RepID=A0ABW1YC37_9DEIO
MFRRPVKPKRPPVPGPLAGQLQQESPDPAAPADLTPPTFDFSQADLEPHAGTKEPQSPVAAPEPRPEAAPPTDAETPAEPGAWRDEAAPTVAPTPRPHRRVTARWKTRLLTALGLLGVAGALAASWFLLPVRSVTVAGNQHLSQVQVQQLAGAEPGFGWLYYGAWRAQKLAQDPWVASATVTRRFPDTLEIQVRERQPYALWEMGGERRVVAADGTVLPEAQVQGNLPVLRGWGPDRLRDSLAIAEALRGYNVKSVAYTPTGITAETERGTAWSGDLESLLKYAGALTQFPGQQIHIYPWG